MNVYENLFEGKFDQLREQQDEVYVSVVTGLVPRYLVAVISMVLFTIKVISAQAPTAQADKEENEAFLSGDLLSY